MARLNYDVIICGGGMTGLAMAAQLAALDLKIAVLESRRPTAFCVLDNFDLRVSAISPQTIALLETLGVWPRVEAMRSCPYRRLRVWEMRDFGDVTFDAAHLGCEELGFVVENRLLQLALWETVEALPQVDIHCPVVCSKFQRVADTVEVLSEDNRYFSGRLLIGADGANSAVREAFGIGVRGSQYRQSCLVASVATELEQQDITWQRFTSSGPQAFLPLPGRHASLVWYHREDQVKALQALEHNELAERIMAAFPTELGAVEVKASGSFPLYKQHANSYIQQNLALIGDAAHSINPLAGQGVNLGFQDSTNLAEVIKSRVSSDRDWWSRVALRPYQSQRSLVNGLMMHAMDGFYYGFSNDITPLMWARNGVLAAARSPLISRRVMRYAMGLDRLPNTFFSR
ncbi:MAG: FAD-dependent monooxygenase [Porticoccaceae bacterium]|nr:FAD-dependent monooxygenase [Porticoccaceae bacterium]